MYILYERNIYIIFKFPAAGKKYCPNGRTGTQKNGCFCIRFFVRIPACFLAQGAKGGDLRNCFNISITFKSTFF